MNTALFGIAGPFQCRGPARRLSPVAGPIQGRHPEPNTPITHGNASLGARPGRRLKDNSGQTTLEFALLATVLILIMMGIIEGGRLFGSWLIITNEAREAARFGVVGLGDPARQPTLVIDVENRVRLRTGGLLDQAQLTPTAVLAPTGLTVHISYNVELFAAPLLVWFPNPVPLTAISTMRIEDGAVGGG